LEALILDNLREQIKSFIINNFMFGNSNGLKDSTSFLNEGIMDSTGALELVSFLEETYGITVEDEELIPENLDSVDNLVGYLKKKGIQSAQAA
jgi:acyl carrier protein